MSEDLTGLVLPEWRPALEHEIARDPKYATRKEVFAAAPLPVLATYFYVSAGCWVLARELQKATGLPLGVEFNPWGRPTHVFLVDGADIIDALGRRPIDVEIGEAEMVGARIEVGVALEDVIALLDKSPADSIAAEGVKRMLASTRYREAAARAAAIVVKSVGLGMR
jgi:hypothetical protein